MTREATLHGFKRSQNPVSLLLSLGLQLGESACGGGLQLAEALLHSIQMTFKCGNRVFLAAGGFAQQRLKLATSCFQVALKAIGIFTQIRCIVFVVSQESLDLLLGAADLTLQIAHFF